ncbi:MAG TPA: DUF6701 domain-containing protein, partial [Ideonella sp.]|nr:DUF6701 domain-containing protein [Ideonella sp.]
LAFNASGVASTTLQYADVGQMSLTAKYTGSGSDANLVMTGTDSFIAAPASFAFSAITAAPIKAGNAFSATLTARNSSGTATPNFGKETPAAAPTISLTRRQPTGTGASDGSFTGSFGSYTGGSATASNLTWSEVGNADLGATLSNYLGSGLSASGSTGSGPVGAVGPFIPHHFDTAVTPGCSGSFSYAGQPFTTTITAKNASGGITSNYDGTINTAPNFAKATVLSDAGSLGLGSFSGNLVAASAFGAGTPRVPGVATATPAYSFTTKQTAEQTLTVRATDADSVSSAGQTEGNTKLRSGRLLLANGYGSEKSALVLSVRAEYWSGQAWVLNSADNCTGSVATPLPASAVALSNVRDSKGNAGSWTTSASAITIGGGVGTLTLAAPTGGATGTVDLAINLGSTTTDQSCNTNHPASTGAGFSWLRSRNGNCAATWDRDPAARASFGVYSPETSKTVHAREIF